MYQFILGQWKTRKTTILLIVIGFFIGCLVMSIGTSVSIESYEYISDHKRGNPEDQLDISLFCNSVWNQKNAEEIIESLSCYGEVQILSMESRGLDQFDERFSIVPTLFHNEPDWHVPLIEGRYFSKEDMNESNPSIIIGKHIALKYNVKLGDVLSIEGERFNVIGICGRPSRETSWEYAIYMSWKEYLEIYGNCFGEMGSNIAISVHLEGGKNDFLENSNLHIDTANQKGILLVYENSVNEISTSTFRNSVIITTVSTVLIFSIAVLNIVHLMIYWLMERRREIGIMKALGANNGFIAKTVVFEVLAISIIGCLLALFVQYLATIFLSNSSFGTDITFRVTWLNLFCAVGVALFFGMIAAIIPALSAMRFEPIRTIHNE